MLVLLPATLRGLLFNPAVHRIYSHFERLFAWDVFSFLGGGLCLFGEVCPLDLCYQGSLIHFGLPPFLRFFCFFWGGWGCVFHLEFSLIVFRLCFRLMF